MKVVRDYLTSQELDYIINAMLEKETALEREIVKVALVAQLVCEDIGDFEDCNDIYDKVVADSKINFDGIVTNYYVIDALVAQETGVNKILKDFIDDMSEKITKAIKNLDLNSAIKELKNISENHQDIISSATPKKTTNKKG